VNFNVKEMTKVRRTYHEYWTKSTFWT